MQFRRHRFALGHLSLVLAAWVGASPLGAHSLELAEIGISTERNLPVLHWRNARGQAFEIQTATSLSDPDWVTVAVLTTDTPEIEWMDENKPKDALFYRVARSSNPTLFQSLQRALDRARLNQRITGASAAVVFPDHGLWLGTSGNSHGSTPIRPDTRFELASITKTFVATLILKLVEQGKLSLDDTIQDWLPDLNHPLIDDSITLRQLLNHRSGVYNFGDDIPFLIELFSDWPRYWEPEEVLDYLRDPYFSPGTSGQYSNTGYVLLGMVIRKATWPTAAAELRRQIFDPLDLRTTVLGGEQPWRGHLAHPHLDFDGDGVHEDLGDLSQTAILTSFWTSGGIVSTPADVATFARALFAGGLLNSSSLQQMREFQPIEIGPVTYEYGLGLLRFDIFNRVHWAHSGGLFGFYSWFSYTPDTDVSMAVCYNYPQLVETGPSLPLELLITLNSLAQTQTATPSAAPAAPETIRFPFLTDHLP